MTPHIFHAVRIPKPAALMVGFLASTVALSAVGIVSGTAQSAQEEREFKNTVPGHVPVKLKLRNEQSFKDKKNKKWARELEIEVKNTGSKPIYFMYLLLVMPDVTIGGHPHAFQLTYGRIDLVRLSTPLSPEDVPIRPGDSVVLKVSESQLKGYESSRDEENRADPEKVKLDFQLINFGDGTGFRGTDGRLHPNPAKKRPPATASFTG